MNAAEWKYNICLQSVGEWKCKVSENGNKLWDSSDLAHYRAVIRITRIMSPDWMNFQSFNHFQSSVLQSPPVKHETLAKLSELLCGSCHRDVGWGSTFMLNFSSSWKKRRAVTMMDSPRRGEKDGQRGRKRGKDWGRYEKKAKAKIKRRTEEKKKSHKGE